MQWLRESSGQILSRSKGETDEEAGFGAGSQALTLNLSTPGNGDAWFPHHSLQRSTKVHNIELFSFYNAKVCDL